MTQTLEQPSVSDLAAWLADRMKGIGASEWATVLGFNPRKSAYTLGLEKLGEIEPEDFSGNEDIEYGLEMESVTLRILAKRTGRIVTPWPQTQFVRSADRSFLGCTPDAIQVDPDKGQAPAQTKNTNAFLLREWRDTPPLLYQVQVQAEMYVMNTTWATLCATIGGNRFKWFDIERNDRFIDAALPVLEKFWRGIEASRPPECDGTASSARALAELYPKDTGLSVHLAEAFKRHFDELTALKRCQKALKDRRTALENELKNAIGDNTTGTLPDGRSFSWKAQTTKAHMVAESTFRVLRQHDSKTVRKTPASIVSQCTAALLAAGGTLYFESPAGSRYFELPGGFLVRLSDHEPNEKTHAWMERREVIGIRTDQDDWQQQLEELAGPLLIEE